VGGGMYVVAIAATLILLAILVAVKPLENVLHKKLRVTGTLAVEIDQSKTTMEVVEKTIGFGHAQIRQTQTVANPNNPNQELRLLVTVDSIDDLEQLASTVRALRGVVSCTIG
jgi:putative Mg2+ transporter-C (MgtC) family protein